MIRWYGCGVDVVKMRCLARDQDRVFRPGEAALQGARRLLTHTLHALNSHNSPYDRGHGRAGPTRWNTSRASVMATALVCRGASRPLLHIGRSTTSPPPPSSRSRSRRAGTQQDRAEHLTGPVPERRNPRRQADWGSLTSHSGKWDPLDAKNAAWAVLSGRTRAPAKSRDGPVQIARTSPVCLAPDARTRPWTC